MKSLEIAVVLNNASMEGEVRADLMRKENDAFAAKVSQLEGDAAATRSVAEERERRLAVLDKHVEDARTALGQSVEASNKLVEEKKALEESLKRATLPGEDETEDLAICNILFFVTS